MKKILLTLIAAIMIGCGSLAAETHRIYAVLFFTGRGGTSVLIQETTDSGSTWSGFNFKKNYLRDEAGNEVKFNNFLPLIGYIESIGWTIPDKEDQIRENMKNVVSGDAPFLVYKDVSEEEWLRWIENGRSKK